MNNFKQSNTVNITGFAAKGGQTDNPFTSPELNIEQVTDTNKMNVFTKEQMPQALEFFFGGRQTCPLVIFESTNNEESNGNPDERILKMLETATGKVLGNDSLYTFTLDEGALTESELQTAELCKAPQQAVAVVCKASEDGYDRHILFVERLAQDSGKHVVLIVPDKNTVTEVGVRQKHYPPQLIYTDAPATTFLNWKDRALVWMADLNMAYSRTRQVYLSCINKGVIKMLTEWMGKGLREDLLHAAKDEAFLNQAYKEYVCSDENIPDVLKCVNCNEKIMVLKLEAWFINSLFFQSAYLFTAKGHEENILKRRKDEIRTESMYYLDEKFNEGKKTKR